MKDVAKQPISVTIKQGASVPVLFAQGAFGGISPRGGEIIMDLYVDTWASPEVQVQVNPDGSANEAYVHTKPSIERTVVGRVILTPDVAHAIGKWLLMNVENAVKVSAVLKEQEGHS